MNRCSWADKSPLVLHYHDCEWGVPQYQTQKLFEILSLEIFQAGLSWNLVLKKRDQLRKDFSGFDIYTVAHAENQIFETVMNDEGGIRNEAKVGAVIYNAIILDTLDKWGINFANELWELCDFTTIESLETAKQTKDNGPCLVDRFAKLFNDYGFRRIGEKNLISFLQASGIINDHEPRCFRHFELYTNGRKDCDHCTSHQ